MGITRWEDDINGRWYGGGKKGVAICLGCKKSPFGFMGSRNGEGEEENRVMLPNGKEAVI